MRGQCRMGRWLMILGPILIALLLLAPLQVHASGIVVLQENISKDLVQVGEMVTFGTNPLPEAGMTVRWNFGDGSPEVTGWPVTHAYTKAGNYTVTALVTYPSTGTTVQATPASIRVVATGNTPPIAQAQVGPRQTLAGLPITFDASGSSDPDGQISRYLWNFGDGSSSALPQEQHAYARPGVYNVILTVTDNGEMDASAIVSVTVTALPESVISGINRAMPACEQGPAPPPFAPLVLVDTGVWEVERFPFRVYEYNNLPLPLCWVAASNQEWLLVVPTEGSRPITATATAISERISVKSTSLLPRAHTNWGMITLVINGWVIEMPVAVTVRGPERDISADVWSLYDELLTYVTEAGERGVMVYTPRYSNGADMALGLITEYVIENGYGGQIARQDFVVKAAELLLDADRNGDGVVGFTDLDLGLGVKVR
jgi:PKD repeat protein